MYYNLYICILLHAYVYLYHLQGVQGLLPQQDHRHERARVVVLVEALQLLAHVDSRGRRVGL